MVGIDAVGTALRDLGVPKSWASWLSAVGG